MNRVIVNDIPHRRPVRRSEQGSALIVALMVVLALTALGLVGLKQTSFELRTSANSRYTAQAFHVSNASLMAFSDQVGSNGQAYWSYMSNLRSYKIGQLPVGSDPEDVAYEYTVHKNDLYADRQFFTAGSSQGACAADPYTEECVGFETEQFSGGGNPFNKIDFDVSMTEPKDGPRAPGFSNQFCFKRFTFTSQAWVGDRNAQPVFGQPAEVSARGHVSYALVGPLDCAGGYYN